MLAAPSLHETDYFIRASASMAGSQPRILKHGDTFGLFDAHGDVLPGAAEAQGLYHRDTRYLSGFHLLIAGRHPLLLSSNLLLNNAALTANLTNPDILDGDTLVLPRDVVHVARTRFIWQGSVYERLALRNFGVEALELDLDLAFADIFEARGFSRKTRGTTRTDTPSNRSVRFIYTGEDGGEDGHVRTTTLRFDPPPDHLSPTEARYRLKLAQGDDVSLFVTVACGDDERAAAEPGLDFFHAYKHARRPIREVAGRIAAVQTSNEVVNEILRRSMADLTMLVTETEAGRYPYAGVPWFSTPFGRDGLITALLML